MIEPGSGTALHARLPPLQPLRPTISMEKQNDHERQYPCAEGTTCTHVGIYMSVNDVEGELREVDQKPFLEGGSGSPSPSP